MGQKISLDIAADQLGVSKRTVRRLISDGELRGYRLGRTRVVRVDAKNGQIHLALGHHSWTAYLADVVQIGSQDRDERRKIIALLSGEGMSQRAIASVVGVSQKTVDRDIGEVSHDDSVEPGITEG